MSRVLLSATLVAPLPLLTYHTVRSTFRWTDSWTRIHRAASITQLFSMLALLVVQEMGNRRTRHLLQVMPKTSRVTTCCSAEYSRQGLFTDLSRNRSHHLFVHDTRFSSPFLSLFFPSLIHFIPSHFSFHSLLLFFPPFILCTMAVDYDQFKGYVLSPSIFPSWDL